MVPNFDIFCYSSAQAVEQTVSLSVIWDDMTLMWRHYNGSQYNTCSIAMRVFIFIIASSNKYRVNEDRVIMRFIVVW